MENYFKWKREDEWTPYNPNYYLIINEFKAKLRLKRTLSASCCDVELTFNVYIFYGGENSKRRENTFMVERNIYETVESSRCGSLDQKTEVENVMFWKRW